MRLTLKVSLIFLIVELGLRLCGIGPYLPHHYKLEADPIGCLLPSKYFGLSLKPGQFSITINEKLSFQATHGADSTRITHLPEISPPKDAPKLYIHGCSFTYGLGVDDSLTYPFLVHQETPFHVTNFAVPGFGSLQALLLTLQHLKDSQKPDILLLNYLHFHDERNSFTRPYRNQLQLALELNENTLWQHQQLPFSIKEWGFTYASLGKDSLRFHTIKAAEMYRHFPLRKHLATVNQAENAYNHISSLFSREQNNKVTQRIIKSLHTHCQQHDIRLIISIMTKDIYAKKLQAFCQSSQIETLDLAIDFENPTFTLQPYDGHPSAAAHRVFADRIKTYLLSAN